jgi:RNase P subunit RPR2
MTEQWLCEACKFILAYIEDKKVVRIKRKDLYVEVKGGEVTVTCCRCGKRNTLIDKEVKS